MTPPPLSPPTDNLYKFLTVGGIALAIFAMTYSRSVARDSLTRAWAVEDSMDAIDVDIERMKQRSDQLSRLFVADSLALARGDQLSPADSVALFPRATRRLEEAREQLAALNKRHKVAGRLIERNQQLWRIAVEDIWLARFWGIFGALYAVGGAALWYFQFQRHQDELLRLQLASAKAKGATAEEPKEEGDGG